jgi:hypothetical protein
LKGTIDGHEALITARGQTPEEFRRNLQAIRGLLDTPAASAPRPQPQGSQDHNQLSPQQHNAAAMHRRVMDFCPAHNVQMQQQHKDGRSWWSHYVQDEARWCKGH